MANRTFILADGENLIKRYEASLEKGASTVTSTVYEPGVLVWHSFITDWRPLEIVRISYYTTVVGDTKKLEETQKKIFSIQYQNKSSRGGYKGQGRLSPHVFKKEKKTHKTKSVDINLTIDALRHSYNNSLDALFLLSGDGDYIPLIEEVKRCGKKVYLGAFSSGLNPGLAHIADDFLNLDNFMLSK